MYVDPRATPVLEFQALHGIQPRLSSDQRPTGPRGLCTAYRNCGPQAGRMIDDCQGHMAACGRCTKESTIHDHGRWTVMPVGGLPREREGLPWERERVMCTWHNGQEEAQIQPILIKLLFVTTQKDRDTNEPNVDGISVVSQRVLQIGCECPIQLP